MKNICYITLLLSFVLAGMVSCGPSPERVVAQAWLNTNSVTANYSPRFFNDLMEQAAKDNITVNKDGTITKGTAVEYVQQYVIGTINGHLKKVEDITAKGDSKELIDASTEVFRYSKNIFENEYLLIAAMIDEGRPQEKILAAIDSMFAKHDGAMQSRFEQLDRYAVPFAEKHNVPIMR